MKAISSADLLRVAQEAAAFNKAGALLVTCDGQCFPESDVNAFINHLRTGRDPLTLELPPGYLYSDGKLSDYFKPVPAKISANEWLTESARRDALSIIHTHKNNTY